MADDSPPAAPASPARRQAWKTGRVAWPPLVASALFLAWMGWFVYADMRANGGRLVYPLDDAYSHMAVAKHLARNGVWGFSAQTGFSSGGSSLLWPLLLAAWYELTGVNGYAPLALNLVAAVATLFYAAGMIRRYTRSGTVGFLILAALVFLTPLPTLALCGMEHTLQILIDLIFIDLASRVLADDEPPPDATRAQRWLPVAAALLTGVRYEGLFLLAVVGLLLLCRRRWWQATFLGVAGGLPVTIFGWYAMSKGWFFLPTSLMLKGHAPSVRTWAGLGHVLSRGYQTAAHNPHLAVVVLAMAAALAATLARRRTLWSGPVLLLVITSGGMIQHLEFAVTTWFYRYEAYLLALGILGVCLAVLDGCPRADPAGLRAGRRASLAGAACAGIVFGAPLAVRAVDSFPKILLAAHNVYEQHYFLAHLLHDFYRGQTVAANDIGAIDFYADIGLVDIWGLGTMEVARAKCAGRYGEDVLRSVFARHDPRVLACYDTWSIEYGGPLPEWVPVGRWTIPDNIVCGSATLSFYAPKPEYVPRLVEALRAFAPRLPRDVTQTGLYVDGTFPHALGHYATVRNEDGRLSYWTNWRTTFYLRPLDGPTPLPSDMVTLILPILPRQKVTGMDVLLNGSPVATRTVSPAEIDHPVPWLIKVRWQPGYNQLCLTGRGPLIVPGGGRDPGLFAVGEPQWIFDPPPVPSVP